MHCDKNFSDEMLKEYISSEIKLINKKKNNPKEWTKNEEYNSQISIRIKEGDNDV